MTTIKVSTYAGTVVEINRKALQKAAKAFMMQGSSPRFENPSNALIFRHLRAKNAAFHHALDRAGLYSLKVEGRKIFVI